MKLKFSRIQRLLTRRDYSVVYASGKKHIGKKILIFYSADHSSRSRLGITISKKWGKAHDRNRFKRIVREAYRQYYPELPLKMELNIHPRQGYKDLTCDDIKQELKNLVSICGKAKS